MNLNRLLCGAACLALLTSPVSESQAGWRKWIKPRCCPTPVVPETTVVPEETDDTAPTDQPSPEFTDVFAEALEAGTAAPTTFAPNMIGDSFGSGCGTASFGGVVSAIVNHPTFACTRTKIAENNSPMPRDRVYFSYHHFNEASELLINNTFTGGFDRSSLDLDRFTFGIEKSFFNGLTSVEVRIPFAYQLSNSILIDSTVPSVSDNRDTQFGNIAVALKALMYRSECFRLSGGLLIQTPTADDVIVRDFEADTDAQGAPQIITNSYHVGNESVVLSPFVGALLTPGERFFLQGFMQYEFDVSGSPVEFKPVVNGVNGVNQRFQFYQQALLRLDLGGGFWIYRNPGRMLSGVAGLLEVHYTTTLDDAILRTVNRDPDEVNPVLIGNALNRVDIWNLTVGPTFQLGDSATLATAAVIPLTGGPAKPFDYEFTVQLNILFGAGR